MNARQTVVLCAVLVFLAVPAWADWDPGDGSKMHYPQLPDPTGWDVALDVIVETDPEGDPIRFRGPLGDDWQCTGTGTVDDIHVWVSFREDQIPDPALGEFVTGFFEIQSNVPADIDPEHKTYSHPGEVLWGIGFDTMMSNVTMRQYGLGDQGWYEPYFGTVVRPDHQKIFQINLDVPQGMDHFVQQEGEIYWLVSHMMVLDATGHRVGKEIGWKTSISPHFMDDAVYGHPYWDQGFPMWVPMVDPDYPHESLDLAFVITTIPEPATAVLLVLGSVGVLAILRRAKK